MTGLKRIYPSKIMLPGMYLNDPEFMEDVYALIYDTSPGEPISWNNVQFLEETQTKLIDDKENS